MIFSSILSFSPGVKIWGDHKGVHVIDKTTMAHKIKSSLCRSDDEYSSFFCLREINRWLLERILYYCVIFLLEFSLSIHHPRSEPGEVRDSSSFAVIFTVLSLFSLP